eukprot:373727-Pyramimonas_sp.AAC.1
MAEVADFCKSCPEDARVPGGSVLDALAAVKTLKRAKEVPRKTAEADPVFEAPRLRELHAVSDNFD